MLTNMTQILVSKQGDHYYSFIVKGQDGQSDSNTLLSRNELNQYVDTFIQESKNQYVSLNYHDQLRIDDEQYIYYPTLIFDHAIIEFTNVSKDYKEYIEKVNDKALFKNSFATRNSAQNGHTPEEWTVLSDDIYENPEIKEFVLRILEYRGYDLKPELEKLLLDNFLLSCPNHISNDYWNEKYQTGKQKEIKK